ncbi:MAG: hypothetical protein J6H31_14285 [Butyrivibrio sp.]|nr:hypothetical protein [Butyrivibrio sp.]
MEIYKYIAIVLVYRNTNDLLECIHSMQAKVNSLKMIVVNAYYDDATTNEVRAIAEKYNCDFLNIENKGYSYGNNVGIEYALKNYLFEYAIISNPDITIQKWKDTQIEEADVIAPMTVNLKGKKQNPISARRINMSMSLIYYGIKKDNKILLGLGILINKISNSLFIVNAKLFHKRTIYAAHGSFLIIKKEAIEHLLPVYDDNMFLFGEEGVLAEKMRCHNFRTIYDDDIIINHKEDGSMKLSDISLNDELKKSNLYFYEKYIMQG